MHASSSPWPQLLRQGAPAETQRQRALAGRGAKPSLLVILDNALVDHQRQSPGLLVALGAG